MKINFQLGFCFCSFKLYLICFPDESGSDSEAGESTSSSYSSLSDFVIDIQNSEINGETPGEIKTKLFLNQSET